MRMIFEGTVTVYRQGVSETLQANFQSDEGHTFWYYQCPKAFNNLAYTDGRNNCFRVSFTANKDGSNPRSVRLLD